MTSPVPPTPPVAPTPPPRPAPAPPVFDPKAAWGKAQLVAIGTEAQFTANKPVTAGASTWHYLAKADERMSKNAFERVDGSPKDVLLRAQERSLNSRNAIKKPLTTAQAILQGEDGALYITSLSAKKWGMTYGTPIDGPMRKDVFKGAVMVAALHKDVVAVVGGEDFVPLGGSELKAPQASRKLADEFAAMAAAEEAAMAAARAAAEAEAAAGPAPGGPRSDDGVPRMADETPITPGAPVPLPDGTVPPVGTAGASGPNDAPAPAPAGAPAQPAAG